VRRIGHVTPRAVTRTRPGSRRYVALQAEDDGESTSRFSTRTASALGSMTAATTSSSSQASVFSTLNARAAKGMNGRPVYAPTVEANSHRNMLDIVVYFFPFVAACLLVWSTLRKLPIG
jgi:hypothetical protein